MSEVLEVSLLLQVQPGDTGHVEGVQELLSGTTDLASSMAAFTAAVDANSALVMSCEGQVHLHLHGICSSHLISCSVVSVQL